MSEPVSESLDPKALAADLMLCYFASRKTGRPFKQKTNSVCSEPVFQPFGPWLERALLDLHERGLIDKANKGPKASKDPRKSAVIVTEAGRERMLAFLKPTGKSLQWGAMAGAIQQRLAERLLAASRPGTEPPPPPRAFDQAQFVADIQAIAPTTPDGWFHDIKVLIAPAYRHFVGQRPGYGLSLAAFKQALLAAHQESALTLSRAELGEDGTPEGQASEIQYLISRFHYIEIDRRPS